MPALIESRPGIWSSQLSDGGPLYTETRLDRPVAEPFNSLSALFFFCIAVYWVWRLRAEFARQRFLTYCAIVLAVGGLGGTLFHGTRASRWFLMMDVLPIGILCLSAGIYLSVRLWKTPERSASRWVGFFSLGLAFLGPALFRSANLPRQVAVTFSYLVFALVVIGPLVLTLKQTAWRDAKLIFTALALFVAALFFRLADSSASVAAVFPMGTHWLWHLFSATAVILLLEYFYRLDPRSPKSP